MAMGFGSGGFLFCGPLSASFFHLNFAGFLEYLQPFRLDISGRNMPDLGAPTHMFVFALPKRSEANQSVSAIRFLPEIPPTSQWSTRRRYHPRVVWSLCLLGYRDFCFKASLTMWVGEHALWPRISHCVCGFGVQQVSPFPVILYNHCVRFIICSCHFLSGSTGIIMGVVV